MIDVDEDQMGMSRDAEPDVEAKSYVRPWTRWVTAGVMVCAIAAAVVFSVLQYQRASDNDAREEALAAARDRVPVLLTYNYRTLTEDLARSVDQTTGKFKTEYRALANDVVERNATQKKVSTTAEVTGAGVVRGDRHGVVVLVFLTQSTTSPGAAPSKIVNRVEVAMEPTDDGWKIAGLTPR